MVFCIHLAGASLPPAPQPLGRPCVDQKRSSHPSGAAGLRSRDQHHDFDLLGGDAELGGVDTVAAGPAGVGRDVRGVPGCW